MTAMCALPPTPTLTGDRWREAWLGAGRPRRAVAPPLDGGAVGRRLLAPRLAAPAGCRRRVDRVRPDPLRHDDRGGLGRRLPQQHVPDLRAAAGAARAAHRAVEPHEPGDVAARPAPRPRPGDDPLLRRAPARPRPGDRRRRRSGSSSGARRHPRPTSPSTGASGAADTAWPPADAGELVLESTRTGTDELAVRGDVGHDRMDLLRRPPSLGAADRPAAGRRSVARLRLARARGRAGRRRPPPTHRDGRGRRSVAYLSAKLCDVFPDGTSQLVTRGFLNLCHRESSLDPLPLVPGEPVTITLDLEATAWIFEAGHRIRLDLAGRTGPTRGRRRRR